MAEDQLHSFGQDPISIVDNMPTFNQKQLEDDSSQGLDRQQTYVTQVSSWVPAKTNRRKNTAY